MNDIYIFYVLQSINRIGRNYVAKTQKNNESKVQIKINEKEEEIFIAQNNIKLRRRMEFQERERRPPK